MITSETFGLTKDGTQVTRYWLSDGKCRVAVLTYGGIIQTIEVPDREGNLVDVILGFDSPAGYEAQTCYIGAMIGRCANRIGRGMFSLNGKDYTLACNDNGVHHLHGGMVGLWIRSTGRPRYRVKCWCFDCTATMEKKAIPAI